MKSLIRIPTCYKTWQIQHDLMQTNFNVDKKAYNTQRNSCLTLVSKAKKDYYNKLDHKNVTDNKTFWKCLKSEFSEKVRLIVKLHWSSNS